MALSLFKLSEALAAVAGCVRDSLPNREEQGFDISREPQGQFMRVRGHAIDPKRRARAVILLYSSAMSDRQRTCFEPSYRYSR